MRGALPCTQRLSWHDLSKAELLSDKASPLDALTADPSDPAFLSDLAEQLRKSLRWSELLEVRLMQARLTHGLPVDALSVSDAPVELRAAIETDYAAACEEVGRGLLADESRGVARYREAWFYLNTAGKPKPMQEALQAVTPTQETSDALIEVALHEGADPPRGLRWLLEFYGTCNSVTQIEGLAPHLPVDALADCAAVLVDHMHAELLANVRGHVEREEGALPAGDSLPKLVAGRDWLFAHEVAHVDASHLAATVRMARAIEDRQHLQTAWELTDYGNRLHASLHYADAAPFDELYPAHRLFFAAQLGKDVDDAIDYFRQRAENALPERDGMAPLETLLVLLHRIGRYTEALREYGRLAPRGAVLSPYVPRPIDMARRSGDWQAFDAVMRERDDVVSLAQGRIARLEQSR